MDDLVRVEDVMAQVAAWQARHAARWWPIRKTIDAAWWCRRTAHDVWHPKPWRRAQWRIQRAQRGWADCDTWNLHYYLARVIGECLVHLRDHGIGYPGDITEQEWADWLTAVSTPLLVDLDRAIEGETFEAGIAREAAERAAQVESMRTLAERFMNLWD